MDTRDAIFLVIGYIAFYFGNVLNVKADNGGAQYQMDVKYSGTYCSNEVDVSDSVRSDLHCANRCSNKQSCKGFFYNTITGKCSTLKKMPNSTNDCQSEQGSVYYKKPGRDDNYGARFVIPVASGDRRYTIYISAKEDTSSVTFASGGTTINTAPISVPANQTQNVTKSDIGTSPSYEYLIMEANTDVSVYLYRTRSSGHAFATNLLPTDVLGRAYFTANLNFTINFSSVCTVYSIDQELTTVEGTTAVTEHGTGVFTDPFLEFKQVFPVLCGSPTRVMVQVPPRETLGTSFYIPKVVHSIYGALITVVTTEDNTEIKIFGDYDREDLVNIKGTRFYREFVAWEVFTILTNKPVLVYLEMRLYYDPSFPLAIVIPSVSQYKEHSIVPVPIYENRFQSYCVDNTGNTVAATETLSFTKPTFCIIVWIIDYGDYIQKCAWSSDITLFDQTEVK